MNRFESATKPLIRSMALLLLALTAGCGGGGGSDGGNDAVLAPTVTPTAPVATTPIGTGVAINSKISATFSKDMAPATINTSTFTLKCPAGVAVAGIVAYVKASRSTTFSPTANLPAGTTCTANITTGAQDTAGVALAEAFVWKFRTGSTVDTTRPKVARTVPAAGATGVPKNTKITATFSEDMDPATITGRTFKLRGPGATAVAGTVSYAGTTATLTASSMLAASTTFTATITAGARDLAGNALANAFVWKFRAGRTADTTRPQVRSTNPPDVAVGVCSNKTINATFSEPMDPLTITTASFTLAVTSGASVKGVVAYDAVTKIATFNPVRNLTGTPATNYTATIKGGANGVKDLAGNSLAADKVTTFTTNASACTTAPALGAAAPFGGFCGSATLTNDGLDTVINGDIGVSAASTQITGLRDSGANVYTVTTSNDGMVNGLIYTLTAPPGSVAGDAVTRARADALVAFNSLSPASLLGGIDVSNLAQCPSCGGAGGGPDELAGRTLPPGVYLSATGTYDIGGAGRATANLTLDAGGDVNAVWVFQSAAGTGTLNVGLTGPATPAVPIQVRLINGAKSKNVFWYVPAGATIGTGSTMVGTMLADASITISTTGGTPPTAVTTTLNGRAIALTAGVTMTNTVVNRPH